MATFRFDVDLTVAPGSPTIVQTNVGFPALSVIVNNYSGYWLFFRDGVQKWVPPFWYGVILTLEHTTDFAYAQIASPFAGAQVPTTQGTRAEIIYTDNPLSFSPGFPTSGSLGGPPPTNIAGNVNITNSSITVLGTVAISGTVNVAGTVAISGTTNVSITNASIAVTGTVAISGTTNVLIANASITVTGSVSLTGTSNVSITNSSLTVNGTVAISGTTNVSITNSSITVAGSVSITGTASVNITNASLAVTGSVSITNAISATITAGTVTVENVTNGILSAAGALRYLGSLSQAGATGTYTISALERAIIVITPQLGQAAFGVQVKAHNVANVTAVSHFLLGGSKTVIAYVNPAIDTQWDVIVTNSIGPANGSFQVFADTELPVVDFVRDGQQASLDSISIVPANDFIGQKNKAGSVPTVPASDFLGQQAKAASVSIVPASDFIGQKNMAGSEPVVIASDQSNVPVLSNPVFPFPTNANHVPAANTVATVTFAAVVGYRWVLTAVIAALRNAGGVATTQALHVTDGGSQIFYAPMTISATSGNMDRIILAGNPILACAIGTAMVVEFTGGPGASNFESITAAAYRVNY